MARRRTEQQQGQPPALQIDRHVVHPLAHSLLRSQVTVALEQSVKTLPFGGFNHPQFNFLGGRLLSSFGGRLSAFPTLKIGDPWCRNITLHSLPQSPNSRHALVAVSRDTEPPVVWTHSRHPG